jgi:hypothetical protein
MYVVLASLDMDQDMVSWRMEPPLIEGQIAADLTILFPQST